MRVRIGKAIPIIPIQKFPNQFLAGQFVGFRSLGNTVSETSSHLALREAQHSRILGLKRDVRQVVQFREQRHMAELAYTSYK